MVVFPAELKPVNHTVNPFLRFTSIVVAARRDTCVPFLVGYRFSPISFRLPSQSLDVRLAAQSERNWEWSGAR